MPSSTMIALRLTLLQYSSRDCMLLSKYGMNSGESTCLNSYPCLLA